MKLAVLAVGCSTKTMHGPALLSSIKLGVDPGSWGVRPRCGTGAGAIVMRCTRSPSEPACRTNWPMRAGAACSVARAGRPCSAVAGRECGVSAALPALREPERLAHIVQEAKASATSSSR